MDEHPILWGRGSSSNVQKVLWTCAELNIRPDHRPLGGEFGGNDADWFLALNPNGTVPVWQEGKFALYESHAIMRHLARRQGGLYGSDEHTKALVDCWLDWFALVFWPPVRMLFLDVVRDKNLSADGPAARDAIENAAAFTRRAANRLEQSRYLAGSVFTLADIALAVGLNRMQGLALGIPVPDRLADWLREQRARPGFAVATKGEPDLPGHRREHADRSNSGPSHRN